MDSIVKKDVHCCQKNLEIFNKIIYKQINHMLNRLGGELNIGLHCMSIEKNVASIPVLLLHNIDPAWETDETDQALREVAVFESALREMGQPLTVITVRNADIAACVRDYDPEKYIVFNWCEEIPGVRHSEALVAQILEDLNFTYTGSPPDVLTFCWDKVKVKQLMNLRGIPTPCWRVYDSANTDDWDCFPAIVKPSREHCSFGLTKEAVVMSPDELRAQVAVIIETFRQPALVEDFIDGREFHISLWGNGSVEMLPSAEMDFGAFGDARDRLCTYESKFRPGSCHYEKIGLLLPAPLSEMEHERLRETCILTYQAIGCRDYARFDIRLREGIFYVLDVNPNADVSAEASMACAAEAAGYTYGEMIGHIIGLAAQRHPVFGPGNV
jgi:D-alanine-D-alanine ligase